MRAHAEGLGLAKNCRTVMVYWLKLMIATSITTKDEVAGNWTKHSS